MLEKIINEPALKLNSLGIKRPKALNIAVTEEKETIDILFTLLEEKEE
jgi:hypothetical protein